jgi:subtilisin-like proprotein convertase family protein
MPNCSSYDCVDHYCEPTCNCYSDAECDDANACTCNRCIDGQCHFLPPGPGCNLNPLCCESEGDCDDDGDPCTAKACVNSICKYVPLAGGCVLPIPLRQNFSTCGTLDYCHWSVVDGPGAEASLDNWLVDTAGALGPDRHAFFDWMPQLVPLDTFLLTPKLDLGGNSTITVQFERVLGWFQDPVGLGVYWSPTGAFAGEELELEAELPTEDFGPEWHHTTWETAAGQGHVGINVASPNSYNLDSLGIDSFRVCPGVPPAFGTPPVDEVVFVGNPGSYTLDVTDADHESEMQFYLSGAPGFVELTNVTINQSQGQYSVDLEVTPDGPGDAGIWTFQVRADDTCLVTFLEVTIEVLETGGWAVWQPEDMDTTTVEPLVTAIQSVGEQAQVFHKLPTLVEFLAFPAEFKGAFLPLGVYGDKHVLDPQDAAIIAQYLDAGGKLYMEGGDAWAYDTWTDAQPYFHVVGLDDGPQVTTDSLFGNHFCAGADYGLSTSYLYNNFLDRIDREVQTSAVPVLSDLSGGAGNNPTYHMAVAYEDPTSGYRTIGTSVPFAALVQAGGGPSPEYLVEQYLGFLEYGYPPCADDVECFDSSYCTTDQCVAAACENTVVGGCLECLDDSHCGLQEACHEREECPGGTCVEGLCDNTGEPCLMYQGWACDPIPMDPLLTLWVSTDTPVNIWPGSPAIYSSTIHIESQYKVGDLSLKVWVQHGYRGDLEIRLTHGPTTVTLKEADVTDSGENVYATYEFGAPAATPGALSAFQGQPLSGDWTLEVEDTFGDDGGQLEHWEFYPWTWCALDSDCDEGNACTVDECAEESGSCLQPYPVDCSDGKACTTDWCDSGEGCIHAPDDTFCDPDSACRLAGAIGCEAIPFDQSVGVFQASDTPVSVLEGGVGDYSVIPVGAAGLVGTVNAKVQITHDAPDELMFQLERYSTEGWTGAFLKMADEGNVYGSSLNRTYTFGVPSQDDLSVFHGLPLAGDWRLTVFDDFSGNGGELVSWKLYFEMLGCATDADCQTGDPCYYGSCNQGTGKCEWVPSDCDDGSICTADSCSSDEPGGCVHVPVNQGAACDDGNVCTENGACNAGVCEGTPVDCDDANSCTDDGCAPPGGCTYDFNSAPCDDGDICTENDACSVGSCMGSPISCDDGNPCTADSCDSENGCEHAPSPGACDDGDPCTNEECQNGNCEVTGQADCDDDEWCTDDSCDPQSGCTHTPNAYSCDDGDPCTLDDVCEEGACQAGTGQQSCDDGNLCTDDACQAGVGCVFTPNAAACDDSDPCTTVDVCSAGVCVGSGALQCDDGNECTLNVCTPGLGCEYPYDNGAPCEFPNHCVGPHTCFNGGCLPGTAIDCDDGNVCTNDSCDYDLGCQHSPNAVACDDMDACTLDDECSGDSCGGTPLVCDDGTACTVDSCDAGSGCVFTPDDTACDDSNDCTDDACDPVTGCSNVVDDTNDCDDGTPCTDDACVDGICVGTDNAGPCDDGDECTLGDVCSGGSCLPGTEQVDCDDGNACTTDSCDPATGCANAPVDEGTPCDDVDGCTDGDACAAGQCIGMPKPAGTAAIYGKVFDARNPTAAMSGATITVANRSPLTCVRSQETTWLDDNTVANNQYGIRARCTGY